MCDDEDRRRPDINKKCCSGQKDGIRYGSASMQGWRPEMEDAHRIRLSLKGEMQGWMFASVFDGHGGDQVSDFSRRYLLGQLLKSIKAQRADPADPLNEAEHNRIKNGIINGFHTFDQKIFDSPNVLDDSGSTAICLFITRTHFYFINVGDSRAVLYNGTVRFATKDHKPSLGTERRRIEAAGGYVQDDRVRGQSHNIDLGLARALGDFEYKSNRRRRQSEQMVISTPDVTVIERNDQTDQFIVLACDGIYDVMSNCELTGFIKTELGKTDRLETVCKHVLTRCLDKGSEDNMSIIILTLPGCPAFRERRNKRKQDFAEMRQTVIDKRIRNNKEKIDGDQNKKGLKNNLGEAVRSQDANKEVATINLNVTAENNRAPSTGRKQAPSSFICFFLNYWRQNGGNIFETAKICGRRWKTLSAVQRRPFQKQFQQKRRNL